MAHRETTVDAPPEDQSYPDAASSDAVALSDSEQASGWRAELELGFDSSSGAGNRTILAHRRHSGPLRVLRAFYPEGPVCHVYVVHPPGGVVGGDRLDVHITAAGGAHALITTPAAGKFYRSEGAVAQQSIELRLDDHTSLEWLPQETIYYPGAQVRQQTTLHLAGAASRFIGWEIACLGLRARNQPFDSGHLMQGFAVWRGNRPLLRDRLRIEGGMPMMHARWGLAGKPVIGTLVACPATREDVEALRETDAARDDGIGITLVDGVLVARCVAEHADAVTRRFVALWQVLRPKLMQRPAVLPRIWAT